MPLLRARLPRPEPDPNLMPPDRRLRYQRAMQLRRAKAQLALLIDEVQPHAAVVLLNDALREALDRLREDEVRPDR